MIKQEEIREGIINNGLVALCAGQGFAIYQNIADRILAYLHSQGVVIKVGGISDDLAQTASESETYYADKVGLSWERTAYLFKVFKDAGYVAVEPLIEEG